MIINRYLIKEILQGFFAVMSILLLVFVGRHFARYLADAAEGRFSGELVFTLLVPYLLKSAILLLPFCLFIAVLLSFGRLYRDNEMTIMAACGVGIGQVIKTVLLFSVFFGLIVAAFSLYISPWAVEWGIQIREQSDAKSELTGLLAGRFKQFGSDKRVYYVERLSEDKKSMSNVFIHNKLQGNFDIFSAREGYQHIDESTGDRFLVLKNGYRYEGAPGKDGFKLSRYEKSAIRIEESAVKPRSRHQDAKSTSVLIGSSNSFERAELQWRLSMPVSAVLLAVLAVFLGKTNPRQGKYSKIVVGILVYVVYNNLMGVSQSWIQRNEALAPLGMWWVHGLMILFIFGFYINQYGFKSLFLKVPAGHGKI